MIRIMKRCVIAGAIIGTFIVPSAASAGVEWCCSPVGIDQHARPMGVLPTAPNGAGHTATPNWGKK